MDRYVSKIGLLKIRACFYDISRYLSERDFISFLFYFITNSNIFLPPCNKISSRLSTRPERKQTRDSLYKGRDKSFLRNDASRRLRRTMFLRGFQLP